jgi:hypothetical protein
MTSLAQKEVYEELKEKGNKKFQPHKDLSG